MGVTLRIGQAAAILVGALSLADLTVTLSAPRPGVTGNVFDVRPLPASFSSRATFVDDDLTMIVRHNPFDPASRGASLPTPDSLSTPPAGTRTIIASPLRPALLSPERIHLRLVGTVFGSGVRPLAVFETPDGSQKIHRSGEDVVPGHATLVQIASDSVVLKIGSSYGRLLARYTAEDDAGGDVRTSGASPSGPVAVLTPTQRSIQRGYFEAAIAHPRSLRHAMSTVANFLNGQPKGFRIVHLAPGGLYAQMGLFPFDTITSVGTQPVSSVADFTQILSSSAASAHFEIHGRRGGHPFVFVYDLVD